MPDYRVTFLVRRSRHEKVEALTMTIAASTKDNAKRSMRKLLYDRGIMAYEQPYAEMVKRPLSPGEVADANHPVKRGADGRWVSACD